MELKKSYKGFIIWVIAFFVISMSVCFLPITETAILTRISMNTCTFGITILTFIIYKTEYVYWYNGMTYEEAVKAGTERRKEFALKHLKRFGCFALIYLIFTIISQLLEVSIWLDITVVTIGLIAVAISTIRFKL